MLSKTILKQTSLVAAPAASFSGHNFSKPAVRVSLTGACGNISYATAFRIAS
jgi:hypothetical protein